MEGVATLKEIRECWTIEDVLHATHLLNIKAENQYRQHQSTRKK